MDVVHAALPWVFHNVVDVPCQGGGFLGAKFDPFQLGVDPRGQTYEAHLLRPSHLNEFRSASNC